MKPIDLHLLNAEAKFKEAINHAFDLGWEASEKRVIKRFEDCLCFDKYDCKDERCLLIMDFIALIKGEK